MRKKLKPKPTAILTSDWHIRGDRPVCRTDDFKTALKNKLITILALGEKYQCPIILAGDVGLKPIWGDKLLNWAIDILQTFDDTEILAIAGQHDLINHRLDKQWDAAVGNLARKKTITLHESVLYEYQKFNMMPFPYSCKLKKADKWKSKNKTIAVIHQMVIQSQGDKLWPDQIANHGKRLLKKYPCYDLIVSGDNHQSFVIEHEGRLLVNPGSLMRTTANQIAHEPSIYLWYARTNTVKRVRLPIEQGVIDREHIEQSKQRDNRIDAFINSLEDFEELGLNFKHNMEKTIQTNKVKKRVANKVWESMR